MVNSISGPKPNSGLKLPGNIKSPSEVIDLLASLEIIDDSGVKLVINDDKDFLSPQKKANAVMRFFKENFNLNPSDLPHFASIVKKDLTTGKLKMGGLA